jgi:hypothetical protein
MRCRCPPESFTPRSPTGRGVPLRQPLDELVRVRRPRRRSTSASDAPGRA